MSEARQAPAETLRIRRFLKISLIVGFLALVNYGGSLVVEQINFQFWPEHERLMITVLWLAIVALMVLLGTRGVVLVYFCTLLSLSLSFTIGRLIPLNSFARFLGWLHLHKARDLVLQLEPLNSEEKLDFLLRSAPSKVIPFLVKHRYLMIAIALNLPGNALIGGGGGIGLISGMSRLYPFPKYILLVSLAIMPLPLLLLAGKLPL
jgi:hypothetical protein